MNIKPNLHRLSLRGKSGIITAIITSSFFYLGKFMVNGFASGEGGIAFLPINFFEFVLAGLLGFGILLSYFVLIIINKRRLKSRKTWTQKAKSIRIQFFIYVLLGIFSLFLLLHFGKIKWILPVILLLFSGFSFHIRKKTIGNSILLTIFGVLSSVMALTNDLYQFELAMFYFGPILVLYSLKPFKSN